MFNLGLFELTIFGIIALIVLGPEKLLVVARNLGRWYAMARRTTSRLQQEFASQLDLLETQAELKKELASFKQSEQKMQSQLARLENALSGRLDLSSLTSDNKVGHTTDEPSAWDKIAQWDDDRQNDNKAIDNFDNQANDNHANNNSHKAMSETPTAPMLGHFFELGEYDKQRRLPKAPFLPNHTPDKLLF